MLLVAKTHVRCAVGLQTHSAVHRHGDGVRMVPCGQTSGVRPEKGTLSAGGLHQLSYLLLESHGPLESRRRQQYSGQVLQPCAQEVAPQDLHRHLWHLGQ